MHDNEWERQRAEVLLKGKVAIDSHEDIEGVGCQRKRFAILDTSPARLLNRFHIMTDDVLREAPVNTFIKQNSHETDSRRRSLASSRNPITCSRVTDGKPSRKSSIDSPASR